MPGHCRALLRIESVDPVSLYKSLEPDNRQAPPHVKVTCTPSQRVLECTVEVKGCEDPRRILTLRNTLDEILVLAKSVNEILS